MIVFSHVEVGNYYYHTVAKNSEDSFRLIWGAFVFGNVYPDISKFASRKHFYEETRSIYKCFLMKAMNPAGSDWDRSMASGVVCHFLCDYFCKYHAKMPYTQKSMILHTSYEVILHIRLNNILLKKSLGLLRVSEQAVFSQTVDHSGADHRKTNHSGTKSSYDLCSMILEYEAKEESLLTDLTFALDAVRHVMKEILSSETALADAEMPEGRAPACRVTV